MAAKDLPDEIPDFMEEVAKLEDEQIEMESQGPAETDNEMQVKNEELLDEIQNLIEEAAELEHEGSELLATAGQLSDEDLAMEYEHEALELEVQAND